MTLIVPSTAGDPVDAGAWPIRDCPWQHVRPADDVGTEAE
jgi:hypothetical protein